MNAQQWIEAYQLEPHPEGGYFHQVEKSLEIIEEKTGRIRARYTSIYFLLTSVNPSRFHRLAADEIWYFHDGMPLTIHMISPKGEYHKIILGKDVSQGQVLQYTVPKATIFGSTVEAENGFALVSCMVAPGFEFDDFELFTRAELLAIYPQYHEIIYRLTADEH